LPTSENKAGGDGTVRIDGGERTEEKGVHSMLSSSTSNSKSFDKLMCSVVPAFSASEGKLQFVVSCLCLSRLAFSDRLNDEADMFEYRGILEVPIHTLWRQNGVRQVQRMLEKFIKVPGVNRNLQTA